MDIHSCVRVTVAILVVCMSAWYVYLKRPAGEPLVVERDNALKALEELRQWGTFLIGIQSGALAVMGFLFEKVGAGSGLAALSDWQKTVGLTAIVLFGASIGIATWLLGALPAVILRIKAGCSNDNDFYFLRLFSSERGPRVGPLTGLQYGLFVMGMLFFAAFSYMRLASA